MTSKLIHRAIELLKEDPDRATILRIQRSLCIKKEEAENLMHKLVELRLLGPDRGYQPQEVLAKMHSIKLSNKLLR